MYRCSRVCGNAPSRTCQLLAQTCAVMTVGHPAEFVLPRLQGSQLFFSAQHVLVSETNKGSITLTAVSGKRARWPADRSTAALLWPLFCALLSFFFFSVMNLMRIKLTETGN